jgi:DNA-binding CsgD family transcriptional regulator
MGHSKALRLRDIRAIFRLVGDVRELGADPRAWRRHMLEQLQRVTGTMVGHATETAAPFDLKMPSMDVIVGVGWPGEAESELGHRYIESGLETDPSIPVIFRLQAAGRNFTRTRRKLVTDAMWYRSSHMDKFRRPLGVDDFVVSTRVVPRLGVASVFVLSRAWGERPIGEVQRRLVHLFHAELGHLWEEAGPAGPDPVAGLPPRLQQTLACLRAGDSEKLIAARLGLSRHTVHNYVKALYRRIGVCSRGELLARCAPRFTDFLPLFHRNLPTATTGSHSSER